MSWDHTDEMEAREYDRAERNRYRCKCGGDMPGYCPGPDRCPLQAVDEPDEDDCDEMPSL